MIIRWRTQDEATTNVHYGNAPNSLTKTINVPGIRTDHVATLTNLTSGARVYYQVESLRDSDESMATLGNDSDHFFQVAPPEGTPQSTRVWIIGDSGTANENARNVYDAYRNVTGSEHTDLFLMLGDNAYDSGTDTEYQAAVFEMYPELLRQTSLWPTLGNHDNYNRDVYLDTFTLPTDSGGVASGTELYYSFDYANIHFICLDSATPSPAAQEDMIAWLEQDLMNTDQDWIVSFFHHGPYTKGSHNSDDEREHEDMREKATTLLEDYGVDLVFSGHSHNYERSMLINGHYGHSNSFVLETMGVDVGNGSDVGGVDANGNFVPGAGDGAYEKSTIKGAVYTVAGTSGKVSAWQGGSNSLVNPQPHPVMKVNLLVHGSVVLEVNGGAMHAQFIDDASQVRDDYTILKGSAIAGAAWSEWQASHFSQSDLTDPAKEGSLWGRQANPDSDGWNNEFEFYLGLDPHLNDEPEISVRAEGSQYIVSFSKNENAPLNWIPLEYSTNMSQWSRENISLVQEATSNGLQLFNATLNQASEDRLFFRFAPTSP